MYSENDLKSPEGGGVKSLTLSQALRIALPRWKFLCLFALVCSVCAAVISIFIPNKYTAKTTILPASNENRAVGFASSVENAPGLEMIGLNADKNASSLLYPEILKSRTLAEEILTKKYSYNKGGRVTVTDLYGYFDQVNPDLAHRALEKITNISFEKRTGIVRLSVTTKSAELSAGIANYYVERLDEFNKHKRKSGAALKRQFIEQRIAENKQELAEAEETLKNFRQSNRHYLTTTDPRILMEHEQLLREVAVKTRVFQMLAEEFESAAIQEKKETPVVAALDTARPPSVKSGPPRVKIVALALLAGLVVSSLFVLFDRLYFSDARYRDIKRFAGRIRFIQPAPGEKTVELKQ